MSERMTGRAVERPAEPSVAYFSMELMLDPEMPTYSGGLGALAGDTVLSAADMKVPLVAVTLLYRKGFFKQRLDALGRQSEAPVDWQPEGFLAALPARAAVTIEDRTVALRAFERRVTGLGGGAVPVYFLDSDLPDNSDWDRALTDHLYGGDARYRLCQEVVLGVGGVRMLRALGYRGIERFHLNEGHAALLTLELIGERLHEAGCSAVTQQDLEAVRRRCVFTTHTPVPAGHDQFSESLVRQVLGPPKRLADLGDAPVTDLARRSLVPVESGFELRDAPQGATFNMTHLALNLSHYVNGVAKKHGEVSRAMFAGYAIDAVTNGVHRRWVAAPMERLFNRYVPGWQGDLFSLRGALNIPKNELRAAHAESKRALLEEVRERTGVLLAAEVLTLGFARRATRYKRADLVFSDLDRLRRLARGVGPLQFVFAGSAHPRDEEGKRLIERVFEAKEALKGNLEVVYLEGYDMAVAKLMTAGTDLWLNTPAPPNEASGTSGMKAAINGVPSLSILDGWWLEGHLEGVTGWAIGARTQRRGDDEERLQDAASLYDQLEHTILPMFYQENDRYTEVRRHAIALNGSFFNTQRMLQQYVVKAYFA